MNVADMEEDFEELYDLYGDKLKMHPLVRIPIRTCMMVYMVHLTNQMAMKAPIPNMQDILKTNPDIARQLATAAMQQQSQGMKQQQQAPPPPPQQAQPSGNPYALGSNFSSSGNFIMMTSGYAFSGAYLHVYPFSTSTGFGTKYTNPVTNNVASTTSSNSVASTYGDTAIAYDTDASPWVYAYAFSESSGFGTKYSDPPVIFTGTSSYGGINFN
jgi:hypothetical protein